MRFVPAGTSTGWPSTVSFGMAFGWDACGSPGSMDRWLPCGPRADVAGPVASGMVEFGPELLHIRDVRANRPVVKSADRAPYSALGDVHDRVRVLGDALPGEDPAGDLVDPAGALPAGRTLAA